MSLREVVLAYFGGEKHGALWLLGAGGAALVAAAALFPARWELRSLGVTLGVMAFLLLAVGAGLYLKTDPQVAALLAQLEADPARLTAEELARMARVQRNFRVIEWVELTVIGLAALGAVAFKHRPAWMGVALGLLVPVAFLLAFDLLADRRGATYLGALEQRAATEGGGGSSAR